VGIVGEFKPAVQKRLKLPQSTAGFEVFLNVCGRADNAYTPLSRFPSTSQDICLEVKNELTFGEFKYAFEELINTQLSADQLIKVEPLDIFTSEAIEGNKRITYRVTLTSYERTLTDEVLNKILDSVASGLSESHHARRI
jgi:phenylalanyl-tRNA synthetase beta subunit